SEEAVFETARSAAGVFTSTVAAAWLLELSGSGVAVLALAVFVKVWPAAEAAARTVIVTVVVAPAARGPRAPVTVEPAPGQPAEAGTTVSPAGSVSGAVVAAAGLGPSLARVSSKSAVPPGATATAGTLFRNCRSAAGMTSVLTVSAALAGSGSRSAESARAPLGTIVPAADIANVPVMAIVSVPSATASVGRVQMTACVPPAAASIAPVKPGAVTVLGVNEGGSGSSTRTSFAVSGPAFLTVIV